MLRCVVMCVSEYSVGVKGKGREREREGEGEGGGGKCVLKV